jgi:hypothetical protein
MKRLFKVEYPNGTSFFEDKEEAKKERDRFNALHKMPYAKIELGPDHVRYGEKGNPRTHSHNARSGGPGNGFKHVKRWVMITALEYTHLRRVILPMAIGLAREMSKAEPHRTFWIVGVKCPGCGRHLAGFAMFSSSEGPRPKKYVIATIAGGEIVGRNTRRH